MVGGTLGALAASDCERIGAGLIAQPINTWSSLAFVVAGAWMLAGVRRGRLRPEAALVAVVTVAVGVGSVAFHGIAHAPWGWLHDAALLSLVALVAARHLRALGLRSRPAWAGPGGALTLGAALPFALPHATNVVVVALVATVVASELVGRVRSAGAMLDVPVAGAFGLGLVAHALGRTGAPLCHPDSVVQLHALWHVCAAVATAWWARRTLAVVTE